jgi:cyclic pyranopterin phosphate synthase
MIDQYGRTIDYLRISLTDRCNLRCTYCMPEEGIQQVSHEEILTYDEIVRICRCMTTLGIRHIRLTGGEPLVRKNCETLVAMLKALPGIETVAMTTNGLLLKDRIEALTEAGLDAVNISLDTLNPEQFHRITRRDRLDDALAGLQAAFSCPQLTVKVNCVPVIEQKENYIALAALAKEHPLYIRFIEQMPIGCGGKKTLWDEASLRDVLEKAYGPMTPTQEHPGNGPGRYYEINGFQGRIGFVSAVSHKFCQACNRLRLTATGALKGCLQYQEDVDLRALLRSGCSDETLTGQIREVIWNKPSGHHFYNEATDHDEQHAMSQIGG